ncbi:MAG TPA: contractile injection system protein, VgrG/Pvc8 family [Polyangiaceae bacterium]|nr:contractile injection system protein, VgrG/Pvc8 family [Polyangiaceae bacterium]
MVPWSYRLKVDGAPASAGVLAAIQEIEVEESLELADILRLHLAIDRNAAGSSWTVVDDDTFRRLRKLELAVTIGSKTEPLIEAYVIDVAIEIAPTPGNSALTVVAMDASVLMDLEEKQRAWPDMSDASIARAVFGDYGFALAVDETQPTRQAVDHTSVQRGTDIQFLRQLALRNGYECFVEIDPGTQRTTGHFHAPRLDGAAQPTLSVHLGTETNVAAFKARYDMLRPTSVKAAGLDVETGEPQSASSDKSEQKSMGTTSTDARDKPRSVLLSNTGLSDAGELATLTQAIVDRSAWAVDAEGELDGEIYGALLRAKRTVLVRGAGTQFSGTYYVTKVHHHFAGGRYVQRFGLRRTATGVPRSQRFDEQKGLPS